MRVLLLAFGLAFGPLLLAGDGQGATLEEGIAAYETGHYQSAIELMKPLTEDGEDRAQALYWMGRSYHAIERDNDAIDALEDAVELEPENVDFRVWLGSSYLLKLNRSKFFKKRGIAKHMREHWEKAVELDPAHVEARESLASYYWYAPGIAGGDRDRSHAHMEVLRELEPARYHLTRAGFLERDEDLDGAVEELNQAAAADPLAVGPHLRLLSIHQEREDWGAAFAAGERALALEPANASALYQTGRAAALSGDELVRGAECLRQYLHGDHGDTMPSLASAHWRLGRIREHEGDLEAARTEYEAALELEPGHDEAKKALKELKKRL